jgi:hypothetical protein
MDVTPTTDQKTSDQRLSNIISIECDAAHGVDRFSCSACRPARGVWEDVNICAYPHMQPWGARHADEVIEMNRCDFITILGSTLYVGTLRGVYPSGLDPFRLVRTVRCPSRRARRLRRALGRRRWRSLGAVTRRESSRYRRLRSAPSGHPRIRDRPNP